MKIYYATCVRTEWYLLVQKGEGEELEILILNLQLTELQNLQKKVSLENILN